MKKQTIILVLATIAILQFLAIVTLLGILTPVMILFLTTAVGTMFPMVITRYTGGLACLLLNQDHQWSDKAKSITMNTCLIIGSILTVFILNHAFNTDTGVHIRLNDYFSKTDFLGLSVIGSIICLVIVRKNELTRNFMGFF